MNILLFTKKKLTSLPFPIGKAVSYFPYSVRPGLSSIYRKRQKQIEFLSNSIEKKKKQFIFEKTKKISVYAYNNIPFYKEFYSSLSVNPNKFKFFDDLNELPIITKSDLQKVPLEFRSATKKNRALVNTGGSSGNPLELYIEPNSIPHEWAHMHHIWKKINFKQSNLKIVFGGRSNIKDIIQYDSARHQLNADIYSGWEKVAEKLFSIFDYYKPNYLHGYPSSIFDFIIWLKDNNHPLLNILQKNIKGMMLGSELPALHIRQQVESLLNCNSVSWYGHTERSVLAYEKEIPGIYYPFITYGFPEAIESSTGHRLIATSYYNEASPLIRYDTGDLINPTFKNNLLESFSIEHGREGEFILDSKGNKIFLTGLIFGRHHKLFENSRHIQIKQTDKGYAEVLVVPRFDLTPSQAEATFDTSNVAIKFNFKIINSPIRTPAGKVPLLIKNSI